jgi:hypothetical protein
VSVDARLGQAVDHLISLQDGDRGVLEVVACGTEAIPQLRRLLFAREPSGLYQPRCRVVEALAALRAEDVLIAFLHLDREIKDPVEQAGEDAVIDAAARALKECGNEVVFRRALVLARTRRLPGAIEVLGSFRRPEALSCLIDALADDMARPAAEAAVRQFGREALPVLAARVCSDHSPMPGMSESELRVRRSVLHLLIELSEPMGLPEAFSTNPLSDEDPTCTVLRCRLALKTAGPNTRREILAELIEMAPPADWRIRYEIMECLAEHPAEAFAMVETMLPPAVPSEEDNSAKAEQQRVLFRLANRLTRDGNR